MQWIKAILLFVCGGGSWHAADRHVRLTFDDDDYRRLAISSVLVSELSIYINPEQKQRLVLREGSGVQIP
jgi:hypothetical protein